MQIFAESPAREGGGKTRRRATGLTGNDEREAGKTATTKTEVKAAAVEAAKAAAG